MSLLSLLHLKPAISTQPDVPPRSWATPTLVFYGIEGHAGLLVLGDLQPVSRVQLKGLLLTVSGEVLHLNMVGRDSWAPVLITVFNLFATCNIIPRKQYDWSGSCNH